MHSPRPPSRESMEVLLGRFEEAIEEVQTRLGDDAETSVDTGGVPAEVAQS